MALGRVVPPGSAREGEKVKNGLVEAVYIHKVLETLS